MRYERENTQLGIKNGQALAGACALRFPAGACPACLKKWNRRGQQAMEYALLISIIAAALIGMYVYGKRGLQGIIKASADQIAPEWSADPRTSSGSRAVTTVSFSTLERNSRSMSARGEQRTSATNTSSASSGGSLTVAESY